MITRIRRSEGDEPERDMQSMRSRDEEQGDEVGRILDGYAKAELELRHERTESMIRKAREQFA